MAAHEKLKRELEELSLAGLYFFLWIGLLVAIKKLVLAEYQIEFVGLSAALIGALVLAKVVLILEHVPLGPLTRSRPAWVEVLLRTVLYSAGVVVVMLLEKGFEPMTIRYALMSTHYRQPLNFTMEGLDAAKHSLQRIKDFIAHLKGASGDGSVSEQVKEIVQKARKTFEEGLDDDLNISAALAAIFDLIHEINKIEINKSDAEQVLSALETFDTILGMQFLAEEESLDEEIERLIEERNQARTKKDFARADEIRDSLKARGITLEDGPDGTRWKRA